LHFATQFRLHWHFNLLIVHYLCVCGALSARGGRFLVFNKVNKHQINLICKATLCFQIKDQCGIVFSGRKLR
jgi:hypothetical protein